jgi:hypothetical protein
MACDEKRLLETDVDLQAHHLQQRLKQKESSDVKFDLVDVKRMAQDLLDAITTLRKHEDQHLCG